MEYTNYNESPGDGAGPDPLPRRPTPSLTCEGLEEDFVSQEEAVDWFLRQWLPCEGDALRRVRGRRHRLWCIDGNWKVEKWDKFLVLTSFSGTTSTHSTDISY